MTDTDPPQTTLCRFNSGGDGEPDVSALADRVDQLDERTEKLAEIAERLTETLDAAVDEPAADAQTDERTHDPAFQ